MTARNFSGLTPIENSAVNQHMPFAQKIFPDEKAFWNVDEWELPAGARMVENKDQAIEKSVFSLAYPLTPLTLPSQKTHKTKGKGRPKQKRWAQTKGLK